MKRYILQGLAALVLAAPILVLAQTGAFAQTVAYRGDLADIIQNPERGFHNDYEIINDPNVNQYVTASTPAGGGQPSPDYYDRTFSRAIANGDTTVHSYIHLDLYQTGLLPQELLTNLVSGLQAVRAAHMKIILRAAYAWSDATDVPESVMIAQIDQLDAVIATNADVVMHMEAGWLGSWGEWHDCQFTDSYDPTEAPTRYRIVKEELNTLPTNIDICIRYPIYNQEMLFLSSCDVPSNSVALSQSDKDRLAFHDDCFLADVADQGTYDQNSWLTWFNVWQKRAWVTNWVTSYGGDIMVGGQTCDATGADDTGCSNVLFQMTVQHVTDMDEDYAPVNLTIWSNTVLAASGNDPSETCWTRLQRKMGYRLRLINATFPTNVAAGAGFIVSADLNNDGYAAVVKPRPMYLVFNNGTSRYNFPLNNVDVRSWRSGPVTLTPQMVTLPTNMPSGTYTVALWLPDIFTDLQSIPAYSIHFADLGIWDPVNGYNILSSSVQVGPPGSSPPNNYPPGSPITLTGFGVRTHLFGFTINSTTNAAMVVQVCADLTHPNWSPVSTNALVGGLCYFNDPGWSNSPSRFYRVLAQSAPLPPTTNVIPATMVEIPGGSFMMGDSLDGEVDAPVNAVSVGAFYMDAYDVTETLWNQVYTWALTNGYSFDDTGAAYPKGTNYPVNTVNWYDCVKWCNARAEMEGRVPAYYTSDAQTTVYRSGQVDLDAGSVNWYAGYRLPTESEWEKAARGGLAENRFPWGNIISQTNANYISEPPYCPYDLGQNDGQNGYTGMFDNNVAPQSNPVGYFLPNGYGLYDMAGNVWQWCWDWYGEYPVAMVSDPRGPATGQIRVIRGGSWTDFTENCRVSNREYFLPSWSFFFGFRTVLTPGQP